MKVEYYNPGGADKAALDKFPYMEVIEEIITNDLRNFSVPFSKVVTEELKEMVSYARLKFKRLLLVGIGGAILNPQSVLEALKPRDGFQVSYLNTTDLEYIVNLLADIKPSETFVVIISKSGATAETYSLAKLLIEHWNNNQVTNLGKSFCIITNNLQSPLANLANKFSAYLFKHENTSGRFSTFTNITAIPAMILGVDWQKFYSGGDEILKNIKTDNIANKIIEGALFLVKAWFGELNLLNITYYQRLHMLLEWCSLVLVETLGKRRKGISPITLVGPQFQHSYMQICIEGHRQWAFSLLSLNNNCLLSANTMLQSEIGGRVNLLHKKQKDTAVLHFKNKVEGREITFTEFNEHTLGRYMMSSIIEAILASKILELDPFSQPGVEKVKAILQNKLC